MLLKIPPHKTEPFFVCSSKQSKPSFNGPQFNRFFDLTHIIWYCQNCSGHEALADIFGFTELCPLKPKMSTNDHWTLLLGLVISLHCSFLINPVSL